MTTLTIKINDKDVAGKHFLGLIKTLPFVSIVSDTKRNGLDAALEDVKQGKIYKAKNTKDLMKKTTK